MRRFCEVLLLALVVGLPFEYYFRAREQSLYTSLKLQLILFMIAWVGVKLIEIVPNFPRNGFSGLLPSQFVSALMLFVVCQTLAAIVAPELKGNAGIAAAKVGLGTLITIAVADAIRGTRNRSSTATSLSTRLLVALAITGFLVSLIGLGSIAGVGFCGHFIDIFQSQRYWVGSRLRFSSTMEYPNTAGNLISASLFASLALTAVQGVPRVGRGFTLFWPVAAVVQGLALIFTYSRGATASAVLSLALAAWMLRKFAAERGWRIAALASLALLLGGIAIQLFRPQPPSHQNIPPEQRRNARYSLAAGTEVKYLQPGREHRETITVRNDSSVPWVGNGFGVAYRWYNLGSMEGTPLKQAANFRDNVVVGMERELEVFYTTPLQEGEYFLIWFIFRRDPSLQEVERSFSPAVLCVVHSSVRPPPPLSDDARRYLKIVRAERQNLVGTSVPTRFELWRAAVRMFQGSPFFGIGPDNFRLVKWKHMDIPKGDENILANSLYFECLAGSGILGLISLLWLLWGFGRIQFRRLRRAESPAEWLLVWFGLVYFVSFLVHGLVDYFLKFTPTYLLFWMMLGLLCAGESETRGVDARRL